MKFNTKYIFLCLVLLTPYFILGCKASRGMIPPTTAKGGNLNPFMAWDHERFFNAIQRGKLDEIQSFLDSGLDVNYTHEKGETALIEASSRCFLSVVQILIEAGAHVNHANEEGDTALIKAIDSQERNTDKTCANRNDLVKALIQAGADVNHANQEGETPLFYASYLVQEETVKTLIKKGADVNHPDKMGDTPLMEASSSGHNKILPIIQELIKARADVNHVNKNGITVLDQAFSNSTQTSTEIIVALIEAGANVNQINEKGDSVLIWASYSGNIEVTKKALEHGADVNYVNKNGGEQGEDTDATCKSNDFENDTAEYTALTWAAVMGHAEIVTLLLDGGANVCHRDKNCLTPLDRARQNEYENIIKILEDPNIPKCKEDS